MIASVLSLPRRILILLVRGYRYFLSPWLQTGCRYEPTCSTYALQALERHGAAAGTYLTLHRLVRCNPFCLGGHDPVPDRAPSLFRGLAARGRHGVDPSPSSSTDNRTSP